MTPDRHRPGTPPAPGSVVLDIGDGVGALVVYVDACVGGEELEVCPPGDLSRRQHTGIHPVDVNGTRRRVAVFPALAVGQYDVLDDDLRPVVSVEVVGGCVADADLTRIRT